MRTTYEIIKSLNSIESINVENNDSIYNTQSIPVIKDLLDSGNIKIVKENSVDVGADSSVEIVLIETHSGDKLLFSYFAGYYDWYKFQIMML